MRPLLRRTTLVLWLMLALLPLRGWAHATMAAAGVHAAASLQALIQPTGDDADRSEHAEDVPPCHMSAPTATGAAGSPHDGGERDGERSATSCLLCDVCHAPLALTAEVRLPAFAPPREAPSIALDTRMPHPAPGRLERPPRSA